MGKRGSLEAAHPVCSARFTVSTGLRDPLLEEPRTYRETQRFAAKAWVRQDAVLHRTDAGLSKSRVFRSLHSRLGSVQKTGYKTGARYR